MLLRESGQPDAQHSLTGHAMVQGGKNLQIGKESLLWNAHGPMTTGQLY